MDCQASNLLRDSVAAILHDDEALAEFYTYLQGEFAAESLDFCARVEEFKANGMIPRLLTAWLIRSPLALFSHSTRGPESV